MKEIFERVESIISPVYLVGGSVRDALMGCLPKDYDFITPHSPDVIEQKIRQANRKPFLTGKRFGTIGVRIDGRLVEITTFRTERYQRGTRKPQVEFVADIMEDLGRRDFTINAIAKRGESLIDPYGGRVDIADKIIRCVGQAPVRFKEDPLRMLRAGRFVAQLGFVIENTTFLAARQMSEKILEVSKERWVAELDHLLVSTHVATGLQSLMDMGLFHYMVPELTIQTYTGHPGSLAQINLWMHTLEVTASIPAERDLRWAALLHGVSRPFTRIDPRDHDTLAKPDILGYEMVIRLGKYLRWSNKRIETVSNLVRNHLCETGGPNDMIDGLKK